MLRACGGLVALLEAGLAPVGREVRRGMLWITGHDMLGPFHAGRTNVAIIP